MFERVLVAYDGSAGAEAALGRGLELAAQGPKELWLVTVHGEAADFGASAAAAGAGVGDGPPPQVARLHAAAEARALAAGVTLRPVAIAGNVAKELVGHASAGNFDLLVLGRSGRSGVWGAFLGTTADKVVRHAPCSVLVVRPAPTQAILAPEPAVATTAATGAATGAAVATTGEGSAATSAAEQPEARDAGSSFCDRCGGEFGSAADLAAHRRLAHSEEPPAA